MKITLEINPYGTDIRDPVEGKHPDEWPVVGWDEGLRATLSDVTAPEKVMRRSLYVEGMGDVAFQKLSDRIRMELNHRFSSEYRDRMRMDFESIEIHAAMRQRFGKEGDK